MKSLFKIILALMLVFNVNNLNAQEQQLPANQVGIYPFTSTVNGLGIGAFYERNINDNMSFVLPFKYLFKDYYGWRDSPYEYTFIEFAPGMKFYPGKRKSRVIYSIGPSLYFNYGKNKDVLNYGRGEEHEKLIERVTYSLGIFANNYLDFNVSDHFVMGLQLGPGMTYVRKQYDITQNSRKTNIEKDVFIPSGQFSISFSYRF